LKALLIQITVSTKVKKNNSPEKLQGKIYVFLSQYDLKTIALFYYLLRVLLGLFCWQLAYTLIMFHTLFPLHQAFIVQTNIATSVTFSPNGKQHMKRHFGVI